MDFKPVLIQSLNFIIYKLNFVFKMLMVIAYGDLISSSQECTNFICEDNPMHKCIIGNLFMATSVTILHGICNDDGNGSPSKFRVKLQ